MTHGRHKQSTVLPPFIHAHAAAVEASSKRGEVDCGEMDGIYVYFISSLKDCAARQYIYDLAAFSHAFI